MRKVLCFLEGLSIGYEAVLLRQHIDMEVVHGVLAVVSIAVTIIAIAHLIPDPAPVVRTRRSRRRMMRLLLVRE